MNLEDQVLAALAPLEGTRPRWHTTVDVVDAVRFLCPTASPSSVRRALLRLVAQGDVIRSRGRANSFKYRFATAEDKAEAQARRDARERRDRAMARLREAFGLGDDPEELVSRSSGGTATLEVDVVLVERILDALGPVTGTCTLTPCPEEG